MESGRAGASEVVVGAGGVGAAGSDRAAGRGRDAEHGDRRAGGVSPRTVIGWREPLQAPSSHARRQASSRTGMPDQPTELHRLHRPAQIRGHHHRDPIGAASPAKLCGQRPTSLGQLPSNQPAAMPAPVIGGQRVGLEDDLNGHRSGVPSANHHSATSRKPSQRGRVTPAHDMGSSHEWDESRLCRGPALTPRCPSRPPAQRRRSSPLSTCTYAPQHAT
jgi:hypothetical protein